MKDSGPVLIAINPGSLLASKMVKEGFGIAGNDLSIGANVLIKLSLEDEYSSASGLYFDNDMGHFNTPHQDASNPEKVANIMTTITSVLNKLSN
ncbi:hypothetical protein [Paraglaciecola algarum]|uniref:hypothetical protein n=1 Tax=Paraglaciecola algarum TaxID=3050085 RepID=UPI0032EA0315